MKVPANSDLRAAGDLDGGHVDPYSVSMTANDKTPWMNPGFGVRHEITENFTAWAIFPDGHRAEFNGCGPDVLKFHGDCKRAGATRVGHQVNA